MNPSIFYNIGITLFLIGLSYGIQQAKIHALTKRLDQMKDDHVNMTNELKGISIDVAKAETNLEETYKKVDKLDGKLDRVLNALNDLNLKVGTFIGNK